MATVNCYRAVAGILLAALLLPHGVGAQAAEAATEVPPATSHAKQPGDGLFGNFSLTSDRSPVHISADQLEFDYRTGVLVYRGGVTVKQADLTLNSDLLRVTLDPKASDQLREVVAEGRVEIAKGDRHASGGKAVFDQASRTIVLSDRATLRDGPNEVAGDRVVVYLDEERSVIEGGTDRVRAVLFPPDKENPDKGDHGGAADAGGEALAEPVQVGGPAEAPAPSGASPGHPDGE